MTLCRQGIKENSKSRFIRFNCSSLYTLTCAACSGRFFLIYNKASWIFLWMSSMHPTRLHVVLIDDNPKTASLVLRLLHYLDYNVQHVGADRLLPQIQQASCDLILLNLAMGIQAADAAALLNQTTPIIAYTSEGQTNDFNNALSRKNAEQADDQWLANTQLYAVLKKLESLIANN